MNFETALKLKRDCHYLIGQKSKYVGREISDIFVLPLGNEKKVIEMIFSHPGQSISEIVKPYDSDKYVVVVVFEFEGNYTFQDISLYLEQTIENY